LLKVTPSRHSKAESEDQTVLSFKLQKYFADLILKSNMKDKEEISFDQKIAAKGDT